MRKTWVQDPKTGKMVPKHEFQAERAHDYHILDDIDPFVSPITQEAITSRSQLRAHNREHGVTDSRDYSREYYEREMKRRHDVMSGNTREAREERLNTIQRAFAEAER